MIARCEDRGLGNQTWDVVRALHPKVLLVRMGDKERGGFAEHPERFPTALHAFFDGSRFADRAAVADWVASVDVVYSAETFYDNEWVLDVARSSGVATVLHANPEFYRPVYDQATQVWLPSIWLWDDTGPEDRRRHVAMPVPWLHPPAATAAPTRFVHVVGHRAAYDRQGTGAFLTALKRVTQPMRVRVIGQDDVLPTPSRVPACVDLEVVRASTLPRYDLYADADVLVAPRRYGGLSMPFLEAAGAGLAVVAGARTPEKTWPVLPVPVRSAHSVATPRGPVVPVDVTVPALASALDALAADRAKVDGLKAASHRWAAQHTWQQAAPLWRDHFEAAIDQAKAQR